MQSQSGVRHYQDVKVLTALCLCPSCKLRVRSPGRPERQYKINIRKILQHPTKAKLEKRFQTRCTAWQWTAHLYTFCDC